MLRNCSMFKLQIYCCYFRQIINTACQSADHDGDASFSIKTLHRQTQIVAFLPVPRCPLPRFQSPHGLMVRITLLAAVFGHKRHGVLLFWWLLRSSRTWWDTWWACGWQSMYKEEKFLCKYVKCSNVICRLFVNDANEECAKLPRQ